MKAIRITGVGGPEVLTLVDDAPEPACGPDEVVVEVAAAALNRADLLQARGLYPPPHGVPQDVPGLEYAGTVVAIGARVTRWKVGARVMGLVGGGAFAARVVTHEREAIAIPDGMSFTDAASIPEAFITAWDALVLQGGMRSGDQVLVHAAASGVGTAGVQLVHALGARAIGTGRSADKLARCTALGLEVSIVVGTPPRFAREVVTATGGRGVDVVLDLVGGSYLAETLAAAAVRARIIVVGLLAGAQAEVPLGMLLGKRARLTGTTLRSRPLDEKIAVAQAFAAHVMPLFVAGTLRPVVDEVVPMAEIKAASARMASNATVGKLVLAW